MNKETLEKYADLELQGREIKAQQEELKPEIVEGIIALGKEKAVLLDEEQEEQIGVFTLVKRKTWKYSKDVKSAKEDLTELQGSEQRDGTATFDEQVTLAFYPRKE